jgi:ATP synthase protein I
MRSAALLEGHIRRSALAEQEPGLDPLDEDARINSLDERLRRARTEEAIRSGEARPDRANDRLASRVLAELVGGLFGGAVVGFALDWLLSTSPWFLIGMLFLGIANGFRNIIRISSGRP